jgi:cell wall-associated NlpC family hydrolase
MRLAIVAFLAAALLAGCSASSPQRPTAATAPEGVVPVFDLGARAAALAAQQVGVPYRYGGRSPQGFDCSGLVWYVYGELGLTVPRTAAEQRAQSDHVDADALRPGDLVFFYTPADHVGVYLGGGEFVHAPSSGKHVERARLDSPYFLLGYAGGGRIRRL